MRKCCFLVCLLLLCTACLKQELQTGLSEQESQEIIVLLKENGIEAAKKLGAGEKEGATWTVHVKGGDQNLFLAWRILQEHGLPRQKAKGLEEVFASSGLIPTASEEKARLIMGLSGEISRTLKSIAGVVDARVHVVLPENSPLVEKSQWSPTTASVLIKYQGDQPPLQAEEVKQLVAHGVEGLAPDHVAVVFKKVETRSFPPKDLGWYLSSQQVTVSALALLGVTTLGSLFLIFRGRQQRVKYQSLQRQLKGAAPRPQLAAEGEGKK